MSQATKRVAEQAFEGRENGIAHSAKRRRRSKKTYDTKDGAENAHIEPEVPAESGSHAGTVASEENGKGTVELSMTEHGKKQKRDKKSQRSLDQITAGSQQDGEHASDDDAADSAQSKKRKRVRTPPDVDQEEPIAAQATTETTSDDRAVGSVVQEQTPSGKKKKRQQRKSGPGLQQQGDATEPTPASLPLEARIEAPTSLPTPSPRKQSRKEETTNAPANTSTAIAMSSKDITASKKTKVGAIQKLPERKLKTGGGWSLSQSSGGIFIDQDPLLVQDNQYLVLPTKAQVQIYATTTSLLVRTMHVDATANITSCVLSTADREHILVSTSEGLLSCWNWATGRKVCEWQQKKGILRILSLGSVDGNENVLLLEENHSGITELVQCSLCVATKSKSGRRTLLSRHHIAHNVRVLAGGGGRLIFVAAGDKLLLGHSTTTSETAETEVTYTWREFAIPGKIISMDAYLHQDERKSKRRLPAVDVAIGLHNGVINIYEDILYKLVGKEKGSENADVVARRLHWHRDAVNTVKWSKDGNYIVSGGNETVLVIWQLDTNQKQFLPHLSTSILNLAISDLGSSYALRLADNSIMILSTADLLPATNITGLSLAAEQARRTPIVLMPTDADTLLAAVPANAISKGRITQSSSTLLQTYNIASQAQVSRQALTRNLTTAINVGPNGQPIKVPDVTQLQISNDGGWVATVDEWTPNYEDLDPLYLVEEVEKRHKGESTLRFWAVNEDKRTWELVTRVDDPHRATCPSVLATTSHPTRAEVATLGSDKCVKLWSPKVRMRDGVAVRDRTGKHLVTWTCSRTINIEDTEDIAGLVEEDSAALSYSEDGSLLAVILSPPAAIDRCVHLFDPRTGELSLKQTGLVGTGPVSLAFSGQRLISLSSKLSIFDVVNLQPKFSFAIGARFGSENGDRLLAFNKHDNTFAIALNPKDRRKSGEVAVFGVDTTEEGPLHELLVDGQVRALLTSPQASGYVLVDKKSRIVQLKPPGTSVTSMIPRQREREDVVRSLDGIFGRAPTVIGEAVEEGPVGLLEGPTSVTGTKSLDDLLGLQSSAKAPPVADLFDQIAAVFARGSVAA